MRRSSVPGPGILGSETRYGNGGMAALEAAHAALALGLAVTLSPRMSASDPRRRHLGLSHHSGSVLELLLAPVEVAVPSDARALWPDQPAWPEAGLAELIGPRHKLIESRIDLEGYASSGLPRRTMGRDLDQDRLFFAAPLAAGAALADRLRDPR